MLAALVGFIAESNLHVDNLFSFVSILVLKLVGTFITVLLLIYEIDRTNSFVKNICRAGDRTNCDAVLASEASRIFGVSWSEVGFQWRIIKQWCLLCITVQAILFCELIWGIVNLWNRGLSLNLNLSQAPIISFCLISSMVTWVG
jgi:hypothetical protein